MSTIVALHAHPDDEALLTGGTLAGLAERGHRVVLVVATAGEHGLAADAAGLGARRFHELERAAAALGCARTVHLGYDDSGWNGSGEPVPGAFSGLDVAEPAAAVAAVLRQERADILIGYDRNGGYGHPDHRQVHRVAREAAHLAHTPRLLEATVDRTAITRAVRLLAVLRVLPSGTDAAATQHWYSDRAAITHRIAVGRALPAKRRALRAHLSQAAGGDGPRTLGLLVRLPPPLSRWVLGTEWFVEPGAGPLRRPLTDILASA